MPYVAISVLCKISVNWLVSYNIAKEKEGVTACQRRLRKQASGAKPGNSSLWLLHMAFSCLGGDDQKPLKGVQHEDTTTVTRAESLEYL